MHRVLSRVAASTNVDRGAVCVQAQCFQQQHFSKRAKVRLFVDFFNMLNSSAYETINVATGTSFGRPSAILAPFTTRIGMRFVF